MEVLVNNETLMVDGTEFGFTDSSALLSWSLRRSYDRRLAQVGTPNGGSDVSIIAFDLRLDLLENNTSLELTRGMEIDIAAYEPLSGPTVPLRARIARIIRARVLDHAFSLPK